MKKLNLLVLSSALILGLASCGGNNNQTSSEQSSDATSVDATDYASLGATAIANISASFDKWTSGITTKQTLSTESKVTDNGKEYTFAITYTISTDAASYLAISEDGATLKVTCDSEDHLFKDAVTAHASINGEEKASKSFNVKVSAKTYIDLAKVYEAADGDTITTRGYVETLNKNNSIITVSSGTSSIALYTSKADYYSGDNALKAGDLIEVTGEVDIYSGLYELKLSAITVLVDDDSVTKPVALTVDGTTDLTNAATTQSRIGVVEGYLNSLTVNPSKTNSSGTRNYALIEATVYVGSASDGWQSVLVHLESDKLSDMDTILASWDYDYDSTNHTGSWGENAPKAGDKVKFSGVMSWYNGAQLTDAKLESKSAWDGDKPSSPEKSVVKTTIAELNKKTAPESDVAYEVSGIYEVSGTTKYLTEPSTGETIMIYNLTANDDKGVTWNGLDGYTYENDADAATSIADLKVGEEVTLKALNAYYTYGKTPEIKANLLSHKTSTYTSYTASVEKSGDDAATVSLSKTEGLAYGDEVSVTATPSTDKYVIDTVTVTDAAGTETDITDTMKFNATCVNKVKVTFKDSSVVLNSTTITATALGAKGSYGNGENKIDGVSWSFTEIMLASGKNNSIQMRVKDPGEDTCKISCAYNTTAFPKAIKNVVITFNSNTIYTNSKTGALVDNTKLCLVASGTEQLSAGVTPCQTEDQGLVYTYTPAGEADTYFAFSHHSSTSGAVYIESIVINFVD